MPGCGCAGLEGWLGTDGLEGCDGCDGIDGMCGSGNDGSELDELSEDSEEAACASGWLPVAMLRLAMLKMLARDRALILVIRERDIACDMMVFFFLTR